MGSLHKLVLAVPFLGWLIFTVWIIKLKSELREMRSSVADLARRVDEEPAHGEVARDRSSRKLAFLSVVDHSAATAGSGCVRIDVLDYDLSLWLDTLACNGHRCPPCFLLNITAGFSRLHLLTLHSCSSMYMSDSDRLGEGHFAQAVQPLQLVNLNEELPVPVSDGTYEFMVPPGRTVQALCEPFSNDMLLVPTSLRTHLHPGANWYMEQAVANFDERYASAMVVRKDGILLLMGGFLCTHSYPLDDVWSYSGNGTEWFLMTASASWSARFGHAAVVRKDGAILVLGGDNSQGMLDDVYASFDGGGTWSEILQVGLGARSYFSAVVLSDGGITVVGGFTSAGVSQVINSWDGGYTWVDASNAPSWVSRQYHGAVAIRSDVILMFGGSSNGTLMNDVWQSYDYGESWSEVFVYSPFSAREKFATVVGVDGAVFILGGQAGSAQLQDVWRSLDGGYSWAQMTSSANWTARNLHSAASLHDGTLILAGGAAGAAGAGAATTCYNDFYTSTY